MLKGRSPAAAGNGSGPADIADGRTATVVRHRDQAGAKRPTATRSRRCDSPTATVGLHRLLRRLPERKKPEARGGRQLRCQ